MLLGVRIKELRKERGFTQAELAQKVSVSKSSISYYESGKKTPPIHTLRLLANALEVRFDSLVGNDYYEVGDSNSQYGSAISHEEVEGILEFRRYPRLYEELIKDPKRFVERVNKKLN